MIKHIRERWKQKKQEKIDKKFFEHCRTFLALYNGGSQCDVFYEGPCCCGAWHDRKEFPRRANRAREGYSSHSWDQVVTSCYQNGVAIPADIEEAGVDESLKNKEF